MCIYIYIYVFLHLYTYITDLNNNLNIAIVSQSRRQCEDHKNMYIWSTEMHQEKDLINLLMIIVENIRHISRS